MIKGIGVDIIEIDRIRRSIERLGDRFLDKVYTPREVLYCNGKAHRFQHYAARFAAKEAVGKLLGSGILSWQEIEVLADPPLSGPAQAKLSGRAAEAVGQKLKSLSRGQQVLCVTHLPQIAAFADQHFLIDKRESDGRTRIKVTLLDDHARTQEVARMVSGATVTETSLQHAAQMIAASR